MKHNGLSIAGFVLSLLGGSILSLILSIIGLKKAKAEGDKTGLAIAGIVLSCLGLLVYIIILAVYGAVLGALLSGSLDAMAMPALL